MEKISTVYSEWVFATAIALFIIHLLMPYSPLEKFPHDSPPPKLLGPFSMGQLVQYIIQTLTLPLILIGMVFLKLPDTVSCVIGFILTGIWWVFPRYLSRKIDKW